MINIHEILNLSIMILQSAIYKTLFFQDTKILIPIINIIYRKGKYNIRNVIVIFRIYTHSMGSINE